MATYSERLKDPRWQKKRLEKLSESQWKCHMCSSADKTLNVHHRRYRSGAMPWEYELGELEVLCEPCHEAVHIKRKLLQSFIDRACPNFLNAMLGYACALTNTAVDARDWGVARGIHDAMSGIALAKSRPTQAKRVVGERSDVDGNVDYKNCSR